MVPGKGFVAHLKKLIYALFVLWLGVLAPLVYFDPFAANHQVQPYHIALFAGRIRLPDLSTNVVGSEFTRQLKQRLNRDQAAISASSPFSGLAHSLQWSMGQPYLVGMAAGLLLLQFGRLRRLAPLFVASAELQTPKKPPRQA